MAWAPDYCTVGELGAFMRISDTADDAVLARAITAASRSVDQATGRQFGLVASVEARYYTLEWDCKFRRWFAPIDDLMTSSGLLVAYDSLGDLTFSDTITGTSLAPANAAQVGQPWTRLWILPTATGFTGGYGPTYGPYVARPDSLRVTARWGWTTVPTAIVEATLMQASRLAVRRDSPYGVAGTGGDGNPLRLMAKVDPDVEVALRPYRRTWGVA
jgi:hypothetical protein